MTTSFFTFWRALANGTRTSPPDRLLILLLVPFSLIYALILRLRAVLYRIGLLKRKRLPCPVISIGNLTVGGTGKTPVTAHIARLLLAQGYRVAVLSRGYGGTLEGTCVVVSDGASVMVQPEQCGDEPYLLASTIPGLMVVTGSDRYAAGMMAMEQLAPDVFLLDDGFQHLRLQRDLNILLLDYKRPFGNGWTLPAGLLRETRSAAQRADLIIHTRCPASISFIRDAVGIPACSARYDLVDAVPVSEGPPVSFANLKRLTIVAFAGIAEPHAFFEGLRDQGLNIVATICFPDHAEYNHEQIGEILNAMRATAADLAITTEKDGVKLTKIPAEVCNRIMLARLSLVIGDSTLLQENLRKILLKQP
jgi:tetraacyldisaccharide 4'-kinase